MATLRARTRTRVAETTADALAAEDRDELAATYGGKG
jgi:hypothetical protein